MWNVFLHVTQCMSSYHESTSLEIPTWQLWPLHLLLVALSINALVMLGLQLLQEFRPDYATLQTEIILFPPLEVKNKKWQCHSPVLRHHYTSVKQGFGVWLTFRSNMIVETIMTCVYISLIFTVNNTFQKLPHVYLIENIMWYVLYHLCIHQLSNKWATEVWK